MNNDHDSFEFTVSDSSDKNFTGPADNSCWHCDFVVDAVDDSPIVFFVDHIGVG